MITKSADLDQGPDDDWSAPLPTYKLFPLLPGTKKPAFGDSWFLLATDDPVQIEKWRDAGYNLGVDCRASGIFGVDTDGAEGETNSASMDLPRTYTMRTPRGGRHLYYAGHGPNSTNKLAPKIDTRGDGGYLVCEGIIDARSGKPQEEWGEYVLEIDCPLAPLPAWIVPKLNVQKDRKAAIGADLDLPQNVMRALSYLSVRKPATEGEGGNDHTYQTAAALRDLGLSADRARDLMLEGWNERCVPPWDEDELSRPVDSAYVYGQNEPGAWALAVNPVERFAGLHFASDPPAPTTGDPGMLDFGEIIRREVPPTPFLWPGWVQKRTTTLHAGRGEALKSYSLLQDGLCIHTSTPIEGTPVERATLVYFSGEDPIEEVITRAQKICRRLNIEFDALAGAKFRDVTMFDGAFYEIADGGAVTPTAFHDRVCDELRAIPAHKFVVLDSCYNFLKFRGSSKIDEGAVKECADRLNRLCADLDASIQLLWHPSQAGQDRGDNSGWSVAWHNAFRCRVGYTPDKGNPGAVIRCVEKRNHGPKPEPVTIHWNDGAILPLGAGDDATPRMTRLVNACVEVAIWAAEHGAPIQKRPHPSGYIVMEIEERCGWKPRAREIKDACMTALYEGRLRYLEGNKDRCACKSGTRCFF